MGWLNQWLTRRQRHIVGRGIPTAVILLFATIQTCGAVEPIDGFITPYRTIEVATAETGIVREIVVRMGDTVEPAQVVARLDDEVHRSLLAIAEKSMQSEGRLRAAQAEARIREQRLGKLHDPCFPPVCRSVLLSPR